MRIAVLVLALALFVSCTDVANAQSLTSNFTVQGELRQGGIPAGGPVDLRFRLYDSLSGPGQLGTQLSATNVALVAGRFTVNLDFGPAAFAGQRRWIEIDVSPAGAGTYATLSPRQELTAAPNATFAATSGQATNAITLNGQGASFYQNAANLAGALNDARLSANVPRLNTTQTFSAQQTFSTQPIFSSASVPFLVNSTTLVPNLNADLLDGQHGSFYLDAANFNGTLLDSRLSTNVVLLNLSQTFNGRPAFNGGTSGISSPFTVDSTMVVSNLNADVLDGFDATEFGRVALANTWSGFNTYNDLRLQLRNSGNTFSTTLSAGSTTATRSVSFPDASGTVITTGNLSSISSVGTNAVNGASIVDGSITGADLAPTAFTGLNIADGSIQTADLANSAVTNAKLASDAVSSSNIVDASVQTADLANNAVTNAKLASDAASLGRVSGGSLFSSLGAIGVGTASPGFPFTVIGTDNQLTYFESSNSSGTWMGLANASPGGRLWSFISSGSGNGEGAGHLLLRNSTAGNVALTILGSNGNVGLGTTAPQQRLSVVGGINVDEGNANTGTYTNSLRFGSFSGEAIGSNRGTGENPFGLDFYTGTTKRMSITNGGNIGIGTASPSTKLDVNGIVRSSSGGFRFPDGTTQATAQVAGPQGPAGPEGPRGPQGPQGLPGVGNGSWSDDIHATYTTAPVHVRSSAANSTTNFAELQWDSLRFYDASGQQTVRLSGPSGSLNLTGTLNLTGPDPLEPQLLVNGSAVIRGNFTALGLKFFRTPNPRNPDTTINYICAEAPEPQMIIRGTAELINGEAFITLPEHFSDLAKETGLTVQVTPLAAESLGLAVVEKRLSGIRVRELFYGRGNYEFDYAITGIRAGFDDYKVIQPKTPDPTR